MRAALGSRVLVTGLPGSGKTSLAMTLSALLDLPHVEVDHLYYGPGYRFRPSFPEELQVVVDGSSWCLDDVGMPESRDITWQAADTLIWIDLPYGVAARRAVRRTWRRLRDHREVMPGCYETWFGWGRPKHPVFLSVLGHGRNRRAMRRRLADPRWQHLQVVHLRSDEEVAELVGGQSLRLAR